MTDTTPLPPLLSDVLAIDRNMLPPGSDERRRLATLTNMAIELEAARKSDRDAMQEACNYIHENNHVHWCETLEPFAGEGSFPCTCGRDAALQTLKDLGITPVIK